MSLSSGPRRPTLAGDEIGDPDVALLEDADRRVDQAVLLRLTMNRLGVEQDDPHLARLESATALE